MPLHGPRYIVLHAYAYIHTHIHVIPLLKILATGLGSKSAIFRILRAESGKDPPLIHG